MQTTTDAPYRLGVNTEMPLRRSPGSFYLRCLTQAAVTAVLAGAACGPVILRVEPMRFQLNSPLANKLSPSPLYVLATHKDVPDILDIEHEGSVWGRVPDFRLFITRDLAHAMGDYFAQVTVVDDERSIPPSPGVIARVQVRHVEVREVGNRGGVFLVTMDWAVAMRRTTDEEYSFSLADRIASNLGGFDESTQGTLEWALRRLTARFMDSDKAPALRFPPASDTTGATAPTIAAPPSGIIHSEPLMPPPLPPGMAPK